MRILDWYVLGQFLRVFVICFLSLTGLYIVFDAFTNLEEFLRCVNEQRSLLELMGAHYGYQSILFFDRISGLLTLTAGMFTVAWLQRHNELTALMAAGISRVRVVVPVLIAAASLSGLAAANRELVIPRFKEELSRRPSDLVGSKGQELKPTYDFRTDVLIRGKATYANEKRIEKPEFRLPPMLQDYGKQVVAENAFYQPPTDGRPGGYLMEEVRQPEGLDSSATLTLDGQPVVITAGDAPGWLEPGQCFVVSEISFDQLTGGQALRQFSSTAQLIAGLQNPSLDFGADVRVAIHSRFVQPFLDVLLLLLGLPMILSRSDRNVFVATGICGLVVTVFMLVVLSLQHAGSIGLLTPVMAAWAPLLFFVPVAVESAGSMWR